MREDDGRWGQQREADEDNGKVRWTKCGNEGEKGWVGWRRQLVEAGLEGENPELDGAGRKGGRR